jgi:hypothetical protein
VFFRPIWTNRFLDQLSRDGAQGRNYHFMDVAGTARTSIDLIDLCDGDPACPDQPILPHCLKTDWREQIAASIIEDILYDHRALPALKLLLLTHARFKLFRRRENGVDDNCNRQSTFKLKMQATLDTGSCFCVAVRLYEYDMLANQLSFRGVMPVNTPPSTLFPSRDKQLALWSSYPLTVPPSRRQKNSCP